MAKRKILVVIGQSNATTLADAQSWEDEHPSIRLRSPLAQPVQFTTNTVASEHFTMPGVFAGGQQAGRYGNLTRGAWQTVDTHGKVVNAVRFLTHYNPTPTGLNLGTGVASTFPGYGSLTGNSSGSVLSTTVRWQYDPAGIVITRERTGSTHTIQAGWVGTTNNITIDPPFFPLPVVGERITYVPTSGAASTTTELRLMQMFGGLHDIGSLFDAPLLSLSGAGHDGGIKRVLDSAGAATIGRITCRSRPGYEGAPVSFARRNDLGLVDSTNNGADTIRVNTQELQVGDAIFFQELIPASGDNIAGIAMAGGPPAISATLYVTAVALDVAPFSNIQVSATKGGAFIPIGALTGFVVWQFAWVAAGITENSTYYITRYATEIEEKAITSWNDGAERINFVTHGLVQDERVRFKLATGATGAMPLTVDTDYYVRIVDKDIIEVSATRGGAALAFGPSTASASVLVRMEAYFHFFVSASVGGPEIVITEDVRSTLLTFQESFRGSLTGLQVRALTGANAGQTVPAGDVYLDSVTGRAVLQLGAAFTTTPSAGDTYAIEPPPLNGKAIPFDKWAYFLPWCPFEGMGQFSSLSTLTVPLSELPGVKLVAGVTGVWPNDVARFYTSGTFSPKINPGQRYYCPVATGAAAFLSETYDGAVILGTNSVATTGATAGVLLRQEGKTNPFPPGFNYPNHYEGVGSYQPFFGPALMPAARQTFATGLAVSLAEFYGETIYVIHVAYGGTNIGHTDTPNGLGSWSATGDPNNIFQRYLDELDSAVLALEAQGDTGDCLGIVWVQGEGDASFEDMANRYESNERRLKTSIKQALKDRGLCSLPIEELRWVSPHCQTSPWQFASVVNAAKDILVGQDVFSATFEQQDLERMSQLTGINGLKFAGAGDVIHYSGGGMTELERRAYAAMIGIGQRNPDAELLLCNIALAHIGQSRKLTSLDDGSLEAEQCKTLFPQMRRQLLSMRQWNFALRRKVLVETTAPASPLYDQYDFCYLVPPEAVNAFAVLPPTAPSDAQVADQLVAQAGDWAQMAAVSGRVDVRFQIEQAAAGHRLLFTDQDDATLRYVADVIDAARWPQTFGTAFALLLASQLATALIRGDEGEQVSARMMRRAGAWLGAASTSEANQRVPQVQHMPSHLAGR